MSAKRFFFHFQICAKQTKHKIYCLLIVQNTAHIKCYNDMRHGGYNEHMLR